MRQALWGMAIATFVALGVNSWVWTHLDCASPQGYRSLSDAKRFAVELFNLGGFLPVTFLGNHLAHPYDLAAHQHKMLLMFAGGTLGWTIMGFLLGYFVFGLGEAFGRNSDSSNENIKAEHD